MGDESQEFRGGDVPLPFLLDLLMVHGHGHLLHHLKGISVLFYGVSVQWIFPIVAKGGMVKFGIFQCRVPLTLTFSPSY